MLNHHQIYFFLQQIKDIVKRIRDFRKHRSKWDDSIKSLFLGLRGLCGRGGGKSVRARGDGGQQISRPSRYNRASGHVNSTKQHAQGLHGSAPDGVLELKEVDTSPHL